MRCGAGRTRSAPALPDADERHICVTTPAFEQLVVRVDAVFLWVFRMRGRWNHNSHYHRLVLKAIRPGATHALDVGCGEGALLEDLVPKVRTVVGIDADPTILRRAAQAAPSA